MSVVAMYTYDIDHRATKWHLKTYRLVEFVTIVAAQWQCSAIVTTFVHLWQV